MTAAAGRTKAISAHAVAALASASACPAPRDDEVLGGELARAVY